MELGTKPRSAPRAIARARTALSFARTLRKTGDRSFAWAARWKEARYFDDMVWLEWAESRQWKPCRRGRSRFTCPPDASLLVKK